MRRAPGEARGQRGGGGGAGAEVRVAAPLAQRAAAAQDFLVPALNILVEKTGVPEDVAGATILAAGCNAPELFVSLVGIFIADSTVGAGTVVGSTPFNLCCISGGASLAVGGALLLNPWIIARETLGLSGAMLLFLWALADARIMYYEAIVIFIYYIGYVLTLAFYPRILKFLFNVKLKGQNEARLPAPPARPTHRPTLTRATATPVASAPRGWRRR